MRGLMTMSPSNVRKSSLALCIFLSALLASVSAQTNPPAGHSRPPYDFTSAVDLARNVANIFFFLALGIVGILSYLQARRSLFTPIKTETFKLQLEMFKELLIYFQKIRRDVDQVFDLKRIFRLNVARLFDTYEDTFFKGQRKFDEEKRSLFFKDLIGWQAEFRPEDVTIVGDYMQKHGVDTKPDITNPAIILANWQKHRHLPEFTSVFREQVDKLNAFIASPLLPPELKELLQTFTQKANANLDSLGEVLTEAARELPEKYPSLDALEKATGAWLFNRYFPVRHYTLREETDKILTFISNYLKIDTLLN